MHGIGTSVSPIRKASEILNRKRTLAFLFRDIATLRTDLPLLSSVDDLLWVGPTNVFLPIADRLDQAKSAKKRLQRSKSPGESSAEGKAL